MGESLEFRVLGTPEVRRGSIVVAAGHPRQLSVLVALLVNANRVVPVDQLLTQVWGERPPAQARSSLYSYLSRLRQVLGAGGAEIVRRARGYALECDPAAVDLHRFRDLVARGELGEALALVRGEPFDGLDSPWFAAHRDAVTDEIVAAELDHADRRLAAGAHQAVLPALTERAQARPLDERLAGQLMRALAGAGRPSEALRHYDELRHRLADELGVDPGPALRNLHAQLLTGESLTPPPSPRQTPRQLPAPPQRFTGRTQELSALDDPAPIIAVTGTGGIGKTWFALHWAHRHADEFPDGQLFVDLRGFGPDDRQVSPEDAVRGFVTALGITPDAVPADPQAQAALYRTLVADKRMLIVIDNAADSAQVVPLLPGAAGCRVLVTSRDRLLGLITAHGARPVMLDSLDHDGAWQLLAARLGVDRLRAEPGAVRELIAHCGGFPLALALVAGRAIAHPGLPLAGLAESLRDEASRLGELDEVSASVPAALSWSLSALLPEHAEAFALLGVPGGPDLSLAAATSLLGVPAQAALRALERVSLLHQHVSGRWRMHDLVALYAAERARLLPADVREAAQRRLLEFYVLTAWHAEQLLSPNALYTALPEPEPGTVALTFGTDIEALDWYTAEHQNLHAARRLAARTGRHRTIWELVKNMTQFYFRRGHPEDSLAMWEAALAAPFDHSPHEIAVIHRRLAQTHSVARRFDDAIRHVERSLELCQKHDLKLHLGHTHRYYGVIHERRGDIEKALAQARLAQAVYHEIDHRRWLADSLNQISYYTALAGRYDEARTIAEESLEKNRALNERWAQGDASDTLGFIARHTGDLVAARSWYEQALTFYLDIGNHVLAANTLASLGDVHADLNEPDQASHHWRQALHYYEEQPDIVKAEEIRAKLAAVTR